MDAMEYTIPEAWTPLRYHTVQQELWTSTVRFPVVVAGRGSGKTELAKRRLVRFLSVKTQAPIAKYFYAAPTERQAKRIAWHHLIKLTPPEWVLDINRSDLIITTIFNSELHIVGFDKPQRIEGDQWAGGIIDECSDIKPKAFDLSVVPALTWHDGWCWRIGVPKRHGIGAIEFKRAFEKAAKGDDPEQAAYTWASKEILPEKLIRWAQANLDPKDYMEQFDAKFQNATGGIYYAFDKDYNVRPCTYDPNLPILVGSDFNVDPMAWILGHAKDGRFEVFDELWLRDSNTPATLDILFSKYGHHRAGFEFYGDATGRARKTAARVSDYYTISRDPRFKELGRTLHYLAGNPNRADRWATTNALICNGAGERRLFIDPKCEHLILDYESRTYKAGTREADDHGDVGHITDACDYVIYKRFPLPIPLDGASGEVFITT